MIVYRKLTVDDLTMYWQIAFKKENPEWSKYNAPYFDEYKKVTFEEFIVGVSAQTFSKNKMGIFVNQQLVGTISRYWEDKRTKWLEVGVVIYDENYWNKGIATDALKFWISRCFEDFEDIERVGFTTWSGNAGMMRVGDKLGMTKEAVLRKVRYYNGVYYDSIKYGVLKEEWEALINLKDDVEKWDIYNEKGELISGELIREQPIADGQYHLVVKTLVVHTDGDILVVQRDHNKKVYPSKYEASAGGNAFKGETSEAAALRELKEETGITAKLRFLESYIDPRYGALFHDYIAVTNCAKDSVVLQEGETIGYKWLSLDAFFDFIKSDVFIEEQRDRLLLNSSELIQLIQQLITNYKTKGKL